MRLRFDVYPADDPKDGALLVSLAADEQLEEGSGLRVELHGLGSGVLVVNKNHPDVTDANLAPGNYVRVYDEDISGSIALFGFFLDERHFQVLSRDEHGGQRQRHGGPGVMSYFGRVILDNYNYVSSGDPRYSPRVDGNWWWYNDQYGDILERMIDEAQDSDRPDYDTLIPAVTRSFTGSSDSNSDAWVSFSGDWSLPIGINYLQVLQRLIDAGLTIKMTPEFVMDAFQSGGYGFDRTGSAYAPDVVLFTSYASAYGGANANILEDLPRQSRPSLPATRVLVRGDSDDPATMVSVTDTQPVTREVFVQVDGTSSPTVLADRGAAELGLRADAADTPTFKHIPGTDAAAGRYSPFPPDVGSRSLLFPRLYPSSTDLGDRKAIHASWAAGAYSDNRHYALTTTQDAGGGRTNNGSGMPEGNAFAHQFKYVLTGATDFTGASVRGQAYVKMRHGLGVGWNIGQSQMVVRLYDSSDVLIATLLGPHEPGSQDSTEWINEHDGGPNPPYRNAMFPADATWADALGAPLASASGVAGDYILIEVGALGWDYSASGWNTDFNNGLSFDAPTNDQSDLSYPVSTGGNAWFEFWGGVGSGAPDYSYWVGDLVTIDTGTGVGDYELENKRVYAINWVVDEAGNWWPIPELGPVTTEGLGLGGNLSAPPSGGGGGGGGGVVSHAPAPLPYVKHLLTNKSGGPVEVGDVVVLDPGNDSAFETTTVAAETRVVGVCLSDIAADAVGPVLLSGYAQFVNTTAAVTRGNYATTSTTAGAAIESATRVEGAFCQFLTGGTYPSAVLFGAPDLGSVTSWKAPVRAATTAAGTLASSFENGDTVDGVVLATGDRILIKDQASGAENGVYVVAASGAPARAADFDGAGEAEGAAVYVRDGTANGDKVFTVTNNGAITIGSTALVFAAISGAGGSLVVQEEDTNVDTAVTTLDFGTGFDLTSSPAGEANVELDYADILANLDISIGNLLVVIGNGVDVITTGVKMDIRMPFAGTWLRWTLLANPAGAIVVDLWKDTFANFPPVVGDSITASAKPTLTATDDEAEDTGLSGWTTSFAEGDIIRVNVDSIATCKRVTLELKYQRT